MSKKRARRHRPDERDAPIRIVLRDEVVYQPPEQAQIEEFLKGLIAANDETTDMLKDLLKRKGQQ